MECPQIYGQVCSFWLVTPGRLQGMPGHGPSHWLMPAACHPECRLADNNNGQIASSLSLTGSPQPCHRAAWACR